MRNDMTRLGDLCEFRYGKSLPQQMRRSGEIPVYGSNGVVGHHDEGVTDGQAIVIGRKGSVGAVHLTAATCWPIDTTYYIDRGATEVDLAWLSRAMSTMQLARLNKAAAVPGLNRSDAYDQKLFVPRIDEQRRIAAILGKADALRRKRKRALDLLDGLTQSVFLEMFGDPVANPKSWEHTTLGRMNVEMSYGPRFYNERYSDEGVRIVRITDLSETGELDFDTMPKLLMSERETETHCTRPGELLFARTGATVGKLALMAESDPRTIPGAYFIRLRFPASVEPLFAWVALRCTSIQNIISEGSRQSAQQNFSGPGLRRLPFILPPLDIQQAFVERVGDVRRLKQRFEHQLRKSAAVFASLQSRAFSGQL